MRSVAATTRLAFACAIASGVVLPVAGVAAAHPAAHFASCRPSASDDNAEQLARAAYTTAAVYGVDHRGSYVGLSPKALNAYEPAVRIQPSHTQPYVTSATGTANTFVVVVQATDGNRFTIRMPPDGVFVTSWTGRMGGCTSRGQRSW